MDRYTKRPDRILGAYHAERRSIAGRSPSARRSETGCRGTAVAKGTRERSKRSCGDFGLTAAREECAPSAAAAFLRGCLFLCVAQFNEQLAQLGALVEIHIHHFERSRL